MTSVYIASAVIVLLIAAVCYAFFVQTVSKKRLQQDKLIQILEQRIKNFRFLLGGFPEGYLPKDLLLVLYGQLVDAAQQLTSLKPKNSQYIDELSCFSREMSDIQRKPPGQKSVRLESPQQGREVKQYLTELNKYLQRLNQRGKLSKTQMEAHQSDIKSLVLNISVDAYIDQARSAESDDKPKMALHYYTLARNLLAKEKIKSAHKELLGELDRHVIRLAAMAAPEQQSDRTPANTDKSEEWDFAKSDESWKKNAIYD